MQFLSIATGEPYDEDIPDEVKLPIHHDEPIPHVRIKTAKRGDADWEESLVRWMFLNGYIAVDMEQTSA